MGSAMVTGRMDSRKKSAATRILEREGMGASQAINLMYDRIIEEGDVSFLAEDDTQLLPDDDRWAIGAKFVDSLTCKRKSRFDDMSKSEIRVERLASRGLI